MSHQGPHPTDVQDLLLALRAIDPTARIATPIHDEIMILCGYEHADACCAVLASWFDAILDRHPAIHVGQGAKPTAGIFAAWPGSISGREFLEQAPELSEEVVDAIIAARKDD